MASVADCGEFGVWSHCPGLTPVTGVVLIVQCFEEGRGGGGGAHGCGKGRIGSTIILTY